MKHKILLLLTGLGLILSGSALLGQARGGSNFNWYTLGSGCFRESYGVVYNYHTAKAAIDSALDSVKASGQLRLRIGIYHGRGLNTGTVMDSTGGNLAPQFRNNLRDLLATIKQKGFSEIMIAFHPQGINRPWTWSTWNENVYQENWNLIYNLRPIVAQNGLLYRMDLLNEGAPRSSQPMLADYCRRLWSDYTYTFGKGDTLGFSMIADDLSRIGMLSYIYKNDFPYLFSLHFYSDTNGLPEYTQFINFHYTMNSYGYNQGWIIGEVFYNNSSVAASLRAAINQTGRTVYYLCQWPVTSDRTCSNQVNVAPPNAFSAYLAQGF